MLTCSEFPVIKVDHLLESEYDDIRLFRRPNAFLQEFGVLWWPNEITRLGTVDIPTAYEDIDMTMTRVFCFSFLQASLCAISKKVS